MATQTLVQSLNSGEYVVMNRRQEETFLAGDTIAAGDAVAFDFSQTEDSDKMLFVVPADAATAPAFVGVAIGDAATGEKVNVVISGMVEANVAGGTAANASVEPSATAGELATYVAGSTAPISAITASAEAAGKAMVVVKKQF